MRYLAAALLVAVTACSSDKDSDKSSTPPVVTAKTDPGTAPGALVAGQLVASTLALQLAPVSTAAATSTTASTTASGLASGTTYANVQGILQTHCIMCHSPSGGQSPNLTAYPFVSSTGEPLSQLLTEMRLRINNQGGLQPMPPTGPLPAADLAVMNAWLAAGAPAASSTAASASSRTTPAAPVANFSGYVVLTKWTSASGAGSSVWQRVSPSPSAAGGFLLPLGLLAVGDQVTVSVQVLGPRGTTVLTKAYPALAVPGTGAVQLQVQTPLEQAASR